MVGAVVDAAQMLTESKSVRRYWSELKRKLAQETSFGQTNKKFVQPRPESGKRR